MRLSSLYPFSLSLAVISTRRRYRALLSKIQRFFHDVFDLNIRVNLLFFFHFVLITFLYEIDVDDIREKETKMKNI